MLLILPTVGLQGYHGIILIFFFFLDYTKYQIYIIYPKCSFLTWFNSRNGFRRCLGRKSFNPSGCSIEGEVKDLENVLVSGVQLVEAHLGLISSKWSREEDWERSLSRRRRGILMYWDTPAHPGTSTSHTPSLSISPSTSTGWFF